MNGILDAYLIVEPRNSFQWLLPHNAKGAKAGSMILKVEAMHANEEIGQLQSDLLRQKEDLHDDFVRIESKLKAARADLSPANLVKKKMILLSGLTLGLGFALGYRDVPIEDIGGSVARSILATAGKQAAIHAIRGR